MFRWYVINTYSGHEKKVKHNIEHRVATIPGSAFEDPAPCSVRISYGALDSDSVIEGLRRLVGGLRALAGHQGR